jgi:hypothetical protein
VERVVLVSDATLLIRVVERARVVVGLVYDGSSGVGTP